MRPRVPQNVDGDLVERGLRRGDVEALADEVACGERPECKGVPRVREGRQREHDRRDLVSGDAGVLRRVDPHPHLRHLRGGRLARSVDGRAPDVGARVRSGRRVDRPAASVDLCHPRHRLVGDARRQDELVGGRVLHIVGRRVEDREGERPPLRVDGVGPLATAHKVEESVRKRARRACAEELERHWHDVFADDAVDLGRDIDLRAVDTPHAARDAEGGLAAEHGLARGDRLVVPLVGRGAVLKRHQVPIFPSVMASCSSLRLKLPNI
jgi:hypothetical protein